MWHDIDLEALATQQKLSGHRVVEDQEYKNSRALVSSDAEHDILENMLEDSKPPAPKITDYLLFTPFRYPPLLEGTRFGKVTERSPFYGSNKIEGALIEKVHRIKKFDDDTAVIFLNRNLSYTSFQFDAEAQSCLNLLTPPFEGYKAEIHNEHSYKASQGLGTEMRACHIQACVFESVRYPSAQNMVIFDPSVFTGKSKSHIQWSCFIGQREITFLIGREKKFTFER